MLSKNVAASTLPQIINILTNLILPTLIITSYGSEINGLVSSTRSIVAYIALVGAGITTAATQSLYKPVAEGDDDTVKGMIHAINKMFNKYGTIYCAIAVAFALVYPFIIKSDIENYTVILLMIVMSLSGASEFFIIGRNTALLYANQKTYVCTTVQAISLLISLILAIIMLEVKANIVLVQLAVSLVYVFRGVLLTGYVKKMYPELSKYKETPPIKQAVAKRKDAMIHQLSGLAVNSSQTIILTIIVGLNAASIYTVYNIVFSGLQSICANLSAAVTPFLGKELALENKERLHTMYNLVEFAFFNIVAFVYSVTAIMIVPFVKLYTWGADINYEYPLFATIFVFTSAFYILKMPGSSIINISGHFRETRSRALIEATIAVTASVIITVFYGLIGVVIGTGLALAWRCIDTIIYTNKHILECKNKRSLTRLLRVLIIIGLFAYSQVFYIVNVSTVTGWIIYAIIASAAVAIVLILNALIFDRESVKETVRILKHKHL